MVIVKNKLLLLTGYRVTQRCDDQNIFYTELNHNIFLFYIKTFEKRNLFNY